MPAPRSSSLRAIGDRNGFRGPLTAQQAVLDELRRQIAVGEIEPGSRLVQDEIARRLGVSHVPVREALKALEAEGQLDYERNRGYTLRRLSADEQRELVVIMRLLETEAIRRSVPRYDDATFQRIDSLVDEMDAASAVSDVARFTALNQAFHFAAFDLCGLPRLLQMLTVAWETSTPYLARFFTDRGARDLIQADHRHVASVCRTKKVRDVIKAMDSHRENGAREQAEALERSNPLPVAGKIR